MLPATKSGAGSRPLLAVQQDILYRLGLDPDPDLYLHLQLDLQLDLQHSPFD